MSITGYSANRFLSRNLPQPVFLSAHVHDFCRKFLLGRHGRNLPHCIIFRPRRAYGRNGGVTLDPTQRTLDLSQWWPLPRLNYFQLLKLRELAAHAHCTVRWHRRRLDAARIDPARPFTLEDWMRLPVLTRRELQRSGQELISTKIPSRLGRKLTNQTSGSTGTPVRVQGTEHDARIFHAVALRHYLWHPHDFRGRYAVIRRMSKVPAEYPAGLEQPRWGDRASFPFETGPAALLSVRASIAQQAQWLRDQDPDYLMTYPSNLLYLAEHCLERGIALPRLKHVATVGEVLKPEARVASGKAWNAPVIDIYSAEEVGVIAHQCPQSEQLHVQAESILVEVIDETGAACAPGEVGRVVVTPLFNYAMPLLRYELGDYAEVGGPCACGRGLPVLTRVLGRERNGLLVAPTGERYWPAFGTRSLTGIAPVLQHQFVQKSLDTIEARLVTSCNLTAGQENGLRQLILSGLPPGFQLTFVYCDEIPRNAGGKFENFISEVRA